jgi:hypothetical protein
MHGREREQHQHLTAVSLKERIPESHWLVPISQPRLHSLLVEEPIRGSCYWIKTG